MRSEYFSVRIFSGVSFNHLGSVVVLDYRCAKNSQSKGRVHEPRLKRFETGLSVNGDISQAIDSRCSD